MLKLPKGLKKKKKGKKSKRKDEELFTEEELEKYRAEHQQPAESGEPSKENEEWSKFKDLTTGIDSVLKKTQGDLDRIKSTSFFQRIPAGVKELPPSPPPPPPTRQVVTVTAADFPQLAAADEHDDASDIGVTDDESEDDQDDIFDTSYVEAVERGEVKLAVVPDSPDDAQDDDLFDTSHLDALIKGQDPKTSTRKKGLDIGIAVSVLTGRIDNVTVTTKRSQKRAIPADLLLEGDNSDPSAAPPVTPVAPSEPEEKSILDLDADIPINTPIDLSVSLHTSLIQQNKAHENPLETEVPEPQPVEEEDDEFTQLAAESLEVSAEVTKLEQTEIVAAPVIQESWSVFEADKVSEVFAEGVAEDQIDVIDPYLDQDDPFDTSFADAVVPVSAAPFKKEAVILEDDDDFDPRAEENRARLNNRRKSSVRIHLTDPSGVRESITSDDRDLGYKEKSIPARDLLGGSTTDLTALGDSPLDPVDINDDEIDPFDTTLVDKIVAPGKVELKLLEQELIGAKSVPAAPVYRVPSDPDFDPRAEEPAVLSERRASRPENLTYSKSVLFDVDSTLQPDKPKTAKPVTPYYTREVSISEDSEDAEANDTVPGSLTRTRSDEDLAPKFTYQTKRRHSELPQSSQSKAKTSLLETAPIDIQTKVLTPCNPKPQPLVEEELDPFDTSFAGELAPTKTELKLLAKEFSCDETNEPDGPKDFLDPSDDIFQIKALTPEPSNISRLPEEELDPFDTSFAGDLQPGRTELNIGEPVAPVTTEAINPFMMTTDEAPVEYTGDNPFAASNPFSDFGYDPPVGDVPSNIFGAEPTGGATQFDGFTAPTEPAGGSNNFENFATSAAPVDLFGAPPVKPTELELVSTTADFSFGEDVNNAAPPRPLPPETQNLILTVTGQMEFTSSHLLDRIPLTRTPSPVSVRDIHSACPTPEPELEPLPLDEPAPVQAAPPAALVQSDFDINRNKPSRPPPARPPAARPPPPRPAPPPVPQALVQQQQATDDINLFDAPAPVTVKPTKEDILSLYSAPKHEEKPIDFLSDDIVDDVPAVNAEVPTATSPPVPAAPVTERVAVVQQPSPPKAREPPPLPPAPTEAAAPAIPDAAPMDCSEPPESAPTTSTMPFAEVMNDNFSAEPRDEEMNPFESGATFTESTPFTEAGTNIFGVQEDAFPAQSNDTFGAADNAFGAASNGAFETSATNIFAASNDAFADNVNSFGMEQGSAFDAPAPATTVASAGWDATPAPAAMGWDAAPEAMAHDAFPESQDAFDAFSAKFDNTAAKHLNSGAWGDDGGSEETSGGFEAEAFDPFLSMGAPPAPAATPRLQSQGSKDSVDDSFSLFIRPKDSTGADAGAAVPALAPPPRPQALPESPRANPFDKSAEAPIPRADAYEEQRRGSGGSGGETPPTPLFDDDVSQPLEDFPRIKYDGPGWEMQLRQPVKKKITGQRFWKKVFVRVATQGEAPVLQLFKTAQDKEPYQELPLQACYSVSEVGAQQFDTFGKIFTVKLQYVFYKERPGVRPGQVTKAERITNKLSQFAAYAIQGDYQGVKEFGSDLRKLGLPVEHAPQVSQLFKLGSLSYEDVIQFSCCIEEALFRLSAHRDRALAYKMEEVQVTAVDELYVEQDADGSVQKQIARVRLFFLAFLSGMPDIELGVNDLRRQGKEVVGRHDIIPVVTEEWIRVEEAEFHACVQPEEFYNTQIIKFKPPDACYIELLRFRVRPPKNRELPLQLKAVWCVTGNKVELRADVLVPGFASRKLGQVPCEDVAIRFPIPECWIYLFRVEKHHRYGSVKSAHRRTGKIKGIERFLGAVDTLSESLIEVTSGQAKYEHQHRALVWRMPRLPKEGQGAYTTHNLVCRMALTSYDQVPAELARAAHVSFTMPATQVSHVTVRSVSLQNHDRDDPPEKYVRYLARHEYVVGIERTTGTANAPSAYAAAAAVPRAPEPAATPAVAPAVAPAAPQPPSSDSDSD
ncbi:protein stoned-B-like [Cydia strobilella]|uniref:protein stoned-B-like n=1 Tax=Cydia strobilella TaxID=1100964 RepID=UPI0030045480